MSCFSTGFEVWDTGRLSCSDPKFQVVIGGQKGKVLDNSNHFNVIHIFNLFHAVDKITGQHSSICIFNLHCHHHLVSASSKSSILLTLSSAVCFLSVLSVSQC